jgi:SAM-dependent methyltransferase/tetratricopeptide (TPR) repeat protein
MANANKLCLNMIVKNEMANLERCLSSVADHIDCWVIGDTGSTDGTPEFIRSFFAARNIPGELHSFPFHNFEQARNAGLDCAYASRLVYDYLLFDDADMELVVEDRDFRSKLTAPAYTVLQRSGISYWNTRLVRRSVGARYRGVTHEYVDIPGGGSQQLQGIWYKDHASGSNRVDKFERDIRLLKEGLEKEPESTRYWFYLAQSYRDAGQTEKAVETYAKRAAMGGWDEEAWYARLQQARALRKLGDEGGFVREALAAFNQRPQRAEPLYDLAKYYREKGSNDASVLFAESGLAIERPNDILFLEDFVYTAGLKEEYSIAANYSRDPARKDRGHAACNWLALNRTIPEGTRNLARSNLFFYVESASTMMPSFSPRQVTFTPPDGYRASNPSITRRDNEIVLVQRCVNYTVSEDARHYNTPNNAPIQTRNYLVRLNESLDTRSSTEILAPLDIPEPSFGAVLGFEDMRLFAWRDELWTCSTIREQNREGYCEQVLARLEEHEPGPHRLANWRVLRPNAPRRHEKNWMPQVVGETLQFMYLCDPTHVIDEQARTVSETTPSIMGGDFRGGSQLIEFDGGWLTLIHEVIFRNGARVYLHRFVWFDKANSLKRVSRLFFLQKKGIEFAAGLAWHPDGNRLIASYGVGDGESWMATIDADEVRRILDDAERLPWGGPTGLVVHGGPSIQPDLPQAKEPRPLISGRDSQHELVATFDSATPNESIQNVLAPSKQFSPSNALNVNSLAAKLNGTDRALWVKAETNRALRNNRAVDEARAATVLARLPLHPDPPKAWDNLLALFHTAATTEPNVPVLDAGAGRESAFLPGLRDLGYTDLTGINLLERGAESVNGICYRFGDITKTDFNSGHFGFVACLSVIEHGVDCELFFKEMARILRPDGHLFVSMDYWQDPIDAGGRMAFGVPVKIFSANDVTNLMKYASHAGFVLVGDMDLSCQQRTIDCFGLQYTFCNLFFRRSPDEMRASGNYRVARADTA